MKRKSSEKIKSGIRKTIKILSDEVIAKTGNYHHKIEK